MYHVAKANDTAPAYVVKTVNLKPGQTLVMPYVRGYREACTIRDRYNETGRVLASPLI